MREKAEWQIEHGKQPDSCLAGSGYMVDCDDANKHSWTDNNWITAVKERAGLKDHA